VIQTIAKSGYRLIAAVEPADGDAPSSPAPAADASTSRPERDRVLMWCAALIAAAGAGAALTLFLERPKPAATARIIRSTLPLGGNTLLDSKDRPAIAMSPDGSRFAFLAIRDGTPRVFLRSMDGRDATVMPGSEGALGLSFSPDGRWVAFWTRTHIKKASCANLSVVTICDLKWYCEGASWTHDGSLVFASNGVLYRVPADGGEPQVVAAPDTKKRPPDFLHEPDVLPSGRFVLATQFRAPYNVFDVVAVSLEDGKRKLLVRDGRWPRYAPSGHIVFAGDQDRLFAVRFDADRVEVTGPPVVVAEGVLWGQFAFDNLGTFLYAHGTSKRYRLAWVDRTGIASPFGRADEYHQPTLSPDGTRIAVGIEPDVYVYNLEQETLSRVIAGAYFPIWTPDGKRLTYVASRGEADELNIWWKNADGTGIEERLTSSRERQTADSWSPDGRLLGFSGGCEGGVCLLEAGNNRTVRCVLCPNRTGYAPMFSPDGRWLALRSGGEVWIRSLDGSREIQVSNEGGDSPLWSRTGKELFFWHGINPPWSAQAREIQMMAVDVVLEPQLRVGKPRVLFQGRYRWGGRANYAVTNDGQRFLMIQAVPNAAVTELQLVVNWFEELRARVRPGSK
jgi:Tol biopolymer transport system component